METAGPYSPERRDALLRSARRIVGETGAEGGSLVHPELAEALAHALSADAGRVITARTAGATSLDDLVQALIDAVVEVASTWQDGLALANAGSERVTDFAVWSRMVAPWVEALETAIADAQSRGIVRGDVDAGTAALVLRDTLDRTAKASILFGHEAYRDTTAALVRAALRA